MQNTQMQYNKLSFNGQKIHFPRKAVIAAILIVALMAFEIFNFDTTRYALRNLLGEVEFMGLHWAAILAIAFCAIDFAGLVRLFTPEQGADEPKEVWYLMGAWLLGATMNAVMTWWAVSVTLLNNPSFGNEVLGREQLLRWVPIFVAVLVWLTRILFIGAFSVAGEHIFDFGDKRKSAPAAKAQAPAAQPQPLRANNSRPTNNGRSRSNSRPKRAPAPRPAMATQPQQTQPMYAATDDVPTFLEQHEPVPAQPTRANQHSNKQRNSRVRQRPPVPSVRRVPAGGVQAKGRQ